MLFVLMALIISLWLGLWFFCIKTKELASAAMSGGKQQVIPEAKFEATRGQSR